MFIILCKNNKTGMDLTREVYLGWTICILGSSISTAIIPIIAKAKIILKLNKYSTSGYTVSLLELVK